MYYIYEYIDPRNNLPFYIGKGKGNRKYAHMNTIGAKKENPDKLKIIDEILAEGMHPIIRELESDIMNEVDAYIREDFYILKYGRKSVDENGILTNKTIHGHPPTPVWDDARKKKHGEFNKEYWTAERRAAHKNITQKASDLAVLASRGTVPVIDLSGKSKRIPKENYLSIDKTIPIEEREYVFTASKEGKRRRAEHLPRAR
jgi:hypothetical protein